MYELINENQDTIAVLDIETVVDEKEKIINERNTTALPFGKIAALGAGFSSLSDSFRTVTQSITTSGEQLYKAVIPDGITGEMTKFKNSDAFTGMIHNKGDLVANIRWTPVEGNTQVLHTTIPYNPATLFMAAALLNIDQKLEKIQEMQREILDFLERNKEAELIGSINTLVDAISHYRFNWNNDKFISAKINLVQDIRRDAKEDEVFYRKSITKALTRSKLINTVAEVKKVAKKVATHLEYYNLSVYMYAFSSFIETLLLGNYNSAFLNNIVADIENYSLKYRDLYTSASKTIEKKMKTALDARMADLIAGGAKNVGRVFSKNKALDKIHADDVFLGLGHWLNDNGERRLNRELRRLSINRDSGASQFARSLELLNETYNSRTEVLFDENNLYLTAQI